MGRRAVRPREAAPGWAVGVDLGATWARVLAIPESGRGSGPGVGRRRVVRRRSPGVVGLPVFLRRLWTRWGLRPGHVSALVVAAKGIWTPAERRTQAQRLRRLARRVRVMADVEAAYHGALDDGPGVLVLSGTGAIALGRDERGRWRRAGGLGPLLGDEGSAFWIGRRWLRATAGADLAAVRRLVGRRDAVARIAGLAPGVLRRARDGHREARAAVAEAQALLAGLLLDVAHGLRLCPPMAVSWAGGLMAEPGFRAGVWRAARRAGLRIAPRPPNESPVAAATRLASRLRG